VPPSAMRVAPLLRCSLKLTQMAGGLNRAL
jgi:hypothetical protein